MSDADEGQAWWATMNRTFRAVVVCWAALFMLTMASLYGSYSIYRNDHWFPYVACTAKGGVLKAAEKVKRIRQLEVMQERLRRQDGLLGYSCSQNDQEAE